MLEKIKNLDIVSKMAGIGVIIVLLIIIVSVSVVSCSSNDKGEPKSTNGDTETEEVAIEEDDSDKVFNRAIAVVNYIDVDTNQLVIYDIEELEMVYLAMDSSIIIKDEYGTDIALSQIEIGDMVEAKYDTHTLKPENVRITAVTWERKDVSNMIIDSENKTIKISNETYIYTDELITSDGGIPFDLDDLSAADEAVVRGYQDTVWSIILLNGHGTIVLENHSSFVGGEIEISNRISLDITATMTIPVSVGIHNIVITKEGMAPYVKQIMVNEDEEVVIDLSEVQPKAGTVEFIVIQEDVLIYIDDVLVNTEEEIILDFGTYKIRVEKENYTTWESELVLNQAYIQYKVDLEKSPSTLYIDEPIGVEAYLDGTYIGIIPTETPFTQGTHKITLRRDGYYSQHYDFLWEDDSQDKNLLLPALIQMPVDEGGDTGDPDTTETPTEDLYGAQ